ncbi:MAG: FtsW/RodA/SpoVE family cell cycle protein [Alphaproteobacteria bacterium]
MNTSTVMAFARTDTSRMSEWWWTVDRWLIAGVGLLIGVGFLMILAAGPAAAGRLGLSDSHFVARQAVFLIPALGLMIGVSLLDLKEARRFAMLLLAGSLFAVVLTHFFGPEIKGAHRWLYIGPFSLQPSEFLKPALAVTCAWLLAEGKKNDQVPGALLAIGLFTVSAALVLLQKDLGQTVLLSLVFGAQLFIAGLPMMFVVVIGILGVTGMVLAYMFLPHVTSRVDRFLDPESGDTYQIDVARDAFEAGGFFGLGPGEGIIKARLPDAHTDYILAVAGEEFGALVCILLIALFAFIVLRALGRIVSEPDHFVQLAAGGLIVQFGMQAIINIGVNLNLMPAKGMTLPFISYGGSSLLALAIAMGFVIAFTRRRTGRIPLLGSIS